MPWHFYNHVLNFETFTEYSDCIYEERLEEGGERQKY